MKRRIKTLLSIGLALLFCIFPTGCALENTLKELLTYAPGEGVFDYSLIERDGIHYLVFDDRSIYSNSTSQVAGIYFASMAEFKDLVTNGKLSRSQKCVIAGAFYGQGHDENGIVICDFDRLYAPILPEGTYVHHVTWGGNRGGDSYYVEFENDSDYGYVCFYYSQEDYLQEFNFRYTNMGRSFTTTIERTEQLEDRNATAIYYDGVQKRIRYTLDNDGQEMIVDEYYYGTNFKRITVYCPNAEIPYFIHIDTPSSRPSVEWLLEFGVEPYVDTPATTPTE